MKKHRTGGRGSFIGKLKSSFGSLKGMKKDEVHIFNVHANYGHYQIVIGPKGGRRASRPIEINGEVHHLFVSPGSIRVYPSKKQMLANMKNTVIMRNLCVHLRDPKGDGRHLLFQEKGEDSVRVRECINLAGKNGERMINKSHHSKGLPMAAYRIIQGDILRALKNKEKEEVMEEIL